MFILGKIIAFLNGDRRKEDPDLKEAQERLRRLEREIEIMRRKYNGNSIGH